MKEFKIRLTQSDVKDFVRAACDCGCDVDIYYNRYIVDAKSLLGVFSLDLRKVLTVCIHGSDAAFEEKLSQYLVRDEVA